MQYMRIPLKYLLFLQDTKSSTSLKFKTEKEVFAYLDFPWLEPHDRNL